MAVATRVSSRVEPVSKFVRPVSFLRSPINVDQVISTPRTAVVNQDRRVACFYIVGVEALRR
jgi:hypothetical protein